MDEDDELLAPSAPRQRLEAERRAAHWAGLHQGMFAAIGALLEAAEPDPRGTDAQALTEALEALVWVAWQDQLRSPDGFVADAITSESGELIVTGRMWEVTSQAPRPFRAELTTAGGLLQLAPDEVEVLGARGLEEWVGLWASTGHEAGTTVDVPPHA